MHIVIIIEILLLILHFKNDVYSIKDKSLEVHLLRTCLLCSIPSDYSLVDNCTSSSIFVILKFCKYFSLLWVFLCLHASTDDIDNCYAVNNQSYCTNNCHHCRICVSTSSSHNSIQCSICV